jgi:protein pelota
MRIEFRDLRHGVVRVRCDSFDDLWYLSQVIAPGDVVKGSSQRRVKDKEDTKSSGGERRTITLAVRVERVDFKAENRVLRVSGVIVEGPDDIVSVGSHHTFNVDADSVVTVVKLSWSRTELDRLDDAVKGALRPKVVVVSLEEGEAVVGLVRESGVEFFDLDRGIGGKYDLKGREARKGEFYRELTVLVGNVAERGGASHIVLSGPGFEKGNYFRFLGENYPQVAAKCVLEDTGSGGRNGIQEVLRRGAVHKALEDVSSARDARFMEDILRDIARGDGLSAYGLADVAKAVEAGAVELFLVTDALFFGRRAQLEPLMTGVRSSRGKVHILGGEGEAGQKLHALGGAAAKLRYRMF